MRLRPDFTEVERNALLELMAKEKARLARLSKKDIALEFYKGIMREYRTMKFVAILRKKIHDKREKQRRFTLRTENEKFLSINQNERLVIGFLTLGH